MKTFTPSDLIALGGLVLATLTTVLGGVVWFANSEKKRYAAERDFAHIRRNQEQMQQGLTSLFNELDRRFDTVERDILEIKTSLKLPKP
ncbi:hypothetical protein NOS3756_27470 [Nostoc sp. NIES-3756]|uniref:hypothetical protein n=1 Tax=Nostoc sp. NIES-3756 TaxID=1751286 RepID=UPI0007206035|nr:hypothetical protein [Nostoc sp. NIES-3756]BAT53784.1 hypothetical protein NOS3756_27470 [Nostoc sp. NIES-3756]